MRITGGPEDVLNLLEGGVLPPDRPSLLVPTDASAVDAVGDGFQLRERQFGRTLDAVGPLLAPGEPYRLGESVHDYAGPEGVERVTAGSRSGARVSASSSSGYPDTVGPVRPEFGPSAVADGSVDTFWRSAPLADSRGEWIEIALPAPRPVEHIDVTAGVDGLSGLPVRSIRVTAGEQSVDQGVDPLSGFTRVRLSGAPVSTIRVSVTAVAGGTASGSWLCAKSRSRALTRSKRPSSRGPGWPRRPTSTSGPTRVDVPAPGPGLPCAATLSWPRSETSQLACAACSGHPTTGTWTPSGTVVATAAPSTLELLDPPGDAARVRASTVLADDPLVAPAFAHDGDPTTWWSSAVGDPAPSLTVSWDAERTADGHSGRAGANLEGPEDRSRRRSTAECRRSSWRGAGWRGCPRSGGPS